MGKNFLVAVTLCWSIIASAQTFDEWRNPEVNAVNRLPMHAGYFAYESTGAAQLGVKEKSSKFMSLNGLWKFDWVKNADARPVGFQNPGFNDKGWAEMPVPGVWELNGYGSPIYLNVGYAWRSQYVNNPPFVPVENNNVGSYRREIMVPAAWKGKDIIAHFGSVTSNIYLWVNGKFVGYSEDSKLEAEFNLTKFLKPGEKNLIAFQVFRWCDGTYLEDQDFFRFSGVGRDCYLYVREKQRVEDIRVTPDLDSDYRNGSLKVAVTVKGGAAVKLSLKDAAGTEVAASQVRGSASVSMNVANPHKWSAEMPYLYTLYAECGSEVIPVKVGFRKVELKNAQVLVDGAPVLFKGVNRHELDPDGGYVVSRERMIQDIELMKKFNVNAVRTCHYPDDNLWYDLCDEYGIYVVAEANLESHGMGYGKESLAHRKDYAQAHIERNIRNVERNFNHPSIIFWSLGNEAGYGVNFEAAYDRVKAEDSSRLVQYERAGYNGKTDVYCPMYIDYNQCKKYCEDEKRVKPLIQCEYAHAMGNSQGGFKEYCDLIRKYPKYQGGFIWDFVDQSVRWKGKNGVQIYGYGGDFNRFDASDENFCDNGLISPDRVPNPHFYEVGYFYQNIWTSAVDASKGVLSVHNENFFRDLSAYYLDWEVTKEGVPVKCGRVENLEVAPQCSAEITLPIGDICRCAEYLLNVSYKLKQREGLLSAGFTVAKQQIVLNPYKFASVELKNVVGSNEELVPPVIADNDLNYLIVSGCGFTVEFNKKSGLMSKYEVMGTDMLNEGATLSPNFWRAPTDNDFGAGMQKHYRVWKSPETKLLSLKHDATGNQAIVSAEYELPAVKAKRAMTYLINNVGAVCVTMKMTADKQAKVPDMFRFGVEMPMPRSFENIEYYGRGPVENYADRKSSMNIGLYSQTVTEQFYPYIRPQECGTKSDIRWWRIANAEGHGLKIHAGAPFSASALHYTIESLDDGLSKCQRHSPEVEQADVTNLCIDKIQAGLGCVNSWGSMPMPEYLVPYSDYEFTFVLTPF